MNRRNNDNTAERIDLALLTKAAFDTTAALRFAGLSGLDTALVASVLARAPDRIRQQASYFAPRPDRRALRRDSAGG